METISAAHYGEPNDFIQHACHRTGDNQIVSLFDELGEGSASLTASDSIGRVAVAGRGCGKVTRSETGRHCQLRRS